MRRLLITLTALGAVITACSDAGGVDPDAINGRELAAVRRALDSALVGDTLLLCSDGLTRMVTDPEIASTLLTSTTAQEAADRLVELANEYGGMDNVTVIVMRVTQKSDGVLDRLKVWKRNSG